VLARTSSLRVTLTLYLIPMKTIPAVILLMCLKMMAADKVLVHGHRGARGVMPENTLPAFEYAIRSGVDVLELDVAVTKDNVLVVSHDPALNPTICKDAPKGTLIRTLTVAEVRKYDCGALQNPQFPRQTPVPGTRIPTLDEVLDLAPRGKFEFNIETKSDPRHPEFTPPPAEFAKLLLDAVRKHGLQRRVIVQSFDFRTLHAMKKLDASIRLSALYGGQSKSFVEIAKESGARIISPEVKLVTKEQVEAAHRAGLQVVPWTANTPEEWQRLVESGVDAIISDYPADLISFLKKSRGR
jgi:glycerophosphoryl diester phosphodiesterase